MHRPLPLSAQTLLLQLAIVVGTLFVAALAFHRLSEASLHEQYGRRALAIAEATAALPSMRESFDDPEPALRIQPLAEVIREASGMSFVVVAAADGIRPAHPDPRRIGERVSTDPDPALRGETGIYTEEGTLGRSVRGKVPVYGEDGDIIGLTSVGILTDEVAAGVRQELPEFLLYVGVALSLGALGSFLLARRVRRQTFNLEPAEIASLYEQREAMLLGIREGVVVVGRDARLSLVNAEARRLLDLDRSLVGAAVSDVVPPGQVRAVFMGEVAGTDAVALSAGRVLVLNRMPVEVRGAQIGAVITLRDRAELEGLLRELDSVRGTADALRAQAHEYSNRLHTIAGLIELGRPDDAVRLITTSTAAHQDLAESALERIGDPTVVALLLMKAAVASERGVELGLADDTRCTMAIDDPVELVTVLGNLIDNALDAVASSPGSVRWVEVSVRADDVAVVVRVHDSGPGVCPARAEDIFREGVSTKAATSGARRGLGLTLVAQLARRRGGAVTVGRDGGAVFTVVLPRSRVPADATGVSA